MRIAIQSSIFLPTPAPGAGALEYLVAELAPRLQRQGHDVTLYAARGSKVPGVNLVTVPPYRTPWQTELAIVDRMEHVARPDVLFDHSRFQLAQTRWPQLPTVTMIHGNAALASHAHNFVFVSRAHGRTFGISDPIALHVSIDVAPFKLGRPMRERGPALWLGRIMPYKRPHLAVEICRRAGVRLNVAGPVMDHDYWATVELNATTQYMGEIRGSFKAKALSDACCLLMTSEAQEPAGLVMLEALASGTPVIGFRHGAAEEFIDEIVGTLVRDETEFADQLVAAFWRYRDPAACRRHVEDHFSLDTMATKALHMLAQVADGATW